MQPLSISEINENLEKLPDWNLEDVGRIITRNFKFEDFKEAVDFVNKVSEIAEAEQHHPDIRIYDYNNVEIKLTTHSAQGLTEKDFDVYLRMDELGK